MPGYDLFVSEANAFPAFVVPTFFISREMNNSSVLLFSYSHFFKVEKRVVHCCKACQKKKKKKKKKKTLKKQ